ncbi:MAG: hypothetical protein ABIJ91_05120 [Candidatus Kuenenbacteria bacterium]
MHHTLILTQKFDRFKACANRSFLALSFSYDPFIFAFYVDFL